MASSREVVYSCQLQLFLRDGCVEGGYRVPTTCTVPLNELMNEAEELRSELSERKPTATRLIFDKSIESDGDMISQDLVDLSYSSRAVLNNPALPNGSPNGSLAVEIMSSLGKMCPDARSPSPINDKEYSHLSIDLPELLGSYCNQELQEKMKREVLHLSEKIADMVLQVEMAHEREEKTADDCSKLEELVRSLEGRISNCSCSGDADFMQRGFESLTSKSTRNHISNDLRINLGEIPKDSDNYYI